MRRSEVLARVNARASARYGIEISENVLYDLLESKIVSAPEKHGRARNWTRSEYRLLLEIARLRHLGISDHREICWMLWLKCRMLFKWTSARRTAIPWPSYSTKISLDYFGALTRHTLRSKIQTLTVIPLEQCSRKWGHWMSVLMASLNMSGRNYWAFLSY